jgi:hypothetical protein
MLRRLGSPRYGRVPYALIVYAVLLCDGTVSLLDRLVGFDYPEHASAEILLQRVHVALSVKGLL